VNAALSRGGADRIGDVRLVRYARALGWGTALLVMLALPASALAGRWIQVSCVNPDGSAATSQGWSGSSQGAPPFGSVASPRCTPQLPMEAGLVTTVDAENNAEEFLQYTPPAGSTLIGGSLNVGLYATGYGTGPNAYTWAATGVLEPDPQTIAANAVIGCDQGDPICQNGTPDYMGTVILPSDAGGDLYVYALCSGFNTSNGECDAGERDGFWALSQVSSARLLLRNDAVPGAADFGGSLLKPDASGAATLDFTAADPGGPGVFAVRAQIDGRTVYDGTPDTEDGSCASVGTDPTTGALMFDGKQPCPASEPVSLAIATGGLRDGKHRVVVTITDVAGNSAVVLTREITTRNSGTTRARSPRLGRMHLSLRWHWDGPRARLVAERISGLPRGSHLSVRCSGAGCPRVSVMATAGPAKVLRAFGERTFRARDHVLFTVSRPRQSTIRVLVTIRSGRRPSLRVLR
jgi:hypothetical protein